jgi:hypothetical protein
MEFIKIAAEVCGSLSAIIALAVIFIKPLRKWALGMHKIEEGQKCLLRGDMLRTYYKHCDEGEIRQYEKENFTCLYNAYKALGGNSFIDDIYEEVREWKVLR